MARRGKARMAVEDPQSFFFPKREWGNLCRLSTLKGASERNCPGSRTINEALVGGLLFFKPDSFADEFAQESLLEFFQAHHGTLFVFREIFSARFLLEIQNRGIQHLVAD